MDDYFKMVKIYGGSETPAFKNWLHREGKRLRTKWFREGATEPAHNTPDDPAYY